MAVLYARGSDDPLLVAKFVQFWVLTSENRCLSLDQSRYNVSASIVKSAQITPKLAQANVSKDFLPHITANINCAENPEKFETIDGGDACRSSRCKQLFFVSEVDMLKAMRQLVLDETLWFDTIDNVTRSGQVGTLLANMTAFISLLVDVRICSNFVQGLNDGMTRNSFLL